jgi:MFS family permease
MCPDFEACPHPNASGNIAPPANAEQCTVSATACPEGASVFGTTLAVDALGGTLAAKMWGMLADSYGRKPFLVLNAAAFCVNATLLFCANSHWLFIMSGAISGFGCCGISTISSYIIDTVPEDRKGMSLGIMVGSIAFAFGTGIPLGAHIYETGACDAEAAGKSGADGLFSGAADPRLVFLLSALGCAFTTIVSLACMPESLSVSHRATELSWSHANPFAALLTFCTDPLIKPHCASCCVLSRVARPLLAAAVPQCPGCLRVCSATP